MEKRIRRGLDRERDKKILWHRRRKKRGWTGRRGRKSDEIGKEKEREGGSQRKRGSERN